MNDRDNFERSGTDGRSRARSLVWLERSAHNRVATGSNPVGPTSFLNELGRELLGGGANSFGDEEHRAAELSRN